ncbi:MAG TPA: OFA family MFS transporter [Bryobacteraceae bacterium]|nr:OFA family MFS transporter [Bryobacteraceae bacterium]
MASPTTGISVAKTHRVRYAALAIFTEFILGVLYTWSVFRGPLAQLHGWTEAQTVAPYRYSILTFAVAMIFAGFWQDRRGPRLVGTISGILLSLGCVLSGLLSGSVTGLILAYGLLCGFGVGFGYVPPIAMCLKWFPDRRGMIVGISVMGAGFGPLLYGPAIEWLIGKDPAAWQTSIPRTFYILAALFAVCVIGAAQFMKLPPPDWKPPGWTPPATTVSAVEIAPLRMVRTWQFYALWGFDFLGSSVGLVAIGAAAPLIQEVSRVSVAAFSGGVAVGVMSVFNGSGRLFWGLVSDRFGRKAAALAMSSLAAIACFAFFRAPFGFWPVVIGLCLAAAGYGGVVALMPALLADYYGVRNLGANYGILYLAWGLAGFLMPGYFAGILDRYRASEGLLAGYHQIYLGLGAMACAAFVLAALLRKPKLA